MILWGLLGFVVLVAGVLVYLAEARAGDEYAGRLAAEARAVAAEATVAAQAAELKRSAHAQRLLGERAKLLAREVLADDRNATRVWAGRAPSPVQWAPREERGGWITDDPPPA